MVKIDSMCFWCFSTLMSSPWFCLPSLLLPEHDIAFCVDCESILDECALQPPRGKTTLQNDSDEAFLKWWSSNCFWVLGVRSPLAIISRCLVDRIVLLPEMGGGERTWKTHFPFEAFSIEGGACHLTCPQEWLPFIFLHFVFPPKADSMSHEDISFLQRRLLANSFLSLSKDMQICRQSMACHREPWIG